MKERQDADSLIVTLAGSSLNSLVPDTDAAAAAVRLMICISSMRHRLQETINCFLFPVLVWVFTGLKYQKKDISIPQISLAVTFHVSVIILSDDTEN